MRKALISVLMAVHSEEPDFLRNSIESILNQTYDNFEFIIVDDYADEAVKNLLEQYRTTDSRIHIIHNGENLGLTKSLNRAYHMSQGEYLARMDADDFAVNNRLKVQYEWMNTHKDVSVLGGIDVDLDNRTYHHGYLTDDMERLKIRVLFNNVVFGHPAAFIRRSFLEQHKLEYDETLKKSQDYGLWVDVITHGGILQSLPKVLVLKREHANQISIKNKDEQIRAAIEIRRRLWNYYGFELSQDELMTIIDLVAGKYSKNNTFKTIKKILCEKTQLDKRQQKYLEEEVFYYYLLAAKGVKKSKKSGRQEVLWSMRIFVPHNLMYLFKKMFIEPIIINSLVRKENKKIFVGRGKNVRW